VVKGNKGTGLSDAEKLGECSMPAKVVWVSNFQHKNIHQPKSVMIFLYKFYRANTALATMGNFTCYLVIYAKDQWNYITTTRDSLQLVGQNLKSKTDNYSKNKNWGFPKGGNSYLWARTTEWNRNKLLSHGNGVSVLLVKTWKGRQSSNIFQNLSDSYYSTGVQKITKPEIKRELSVAIECSYKQLFDINIYKSAYQKLKSNPGNLTEGTDNETLDGISLEWAQDVINQMKDRNFQFKPYLRVYIPKKNSIGKLRPLGIPSPRDKIIQQAIRMILESIYEPLFLNTSHGFRPNRSTTTAVFEITKWTGITWMIEGDIKGYFDNIDHHILASLLKKQIKDTNLMDLYWKLVNAGYVNDGKFTRTNLGVPQGGVLSPLLSNIYLHEFDIFMNSLIEKYSNWDKRVSKANPTYIRQRKIISRLEEIEDPEEATKKVLLDLKASFIKTPSVIRDDSTATRLYYNRYADDWVVGISGSLNFAKTIKEEIKDFLNNTLKLTLREENTKISHLESEKVKYLGFLISRRKRRYTESQISTVKSGKGKTKIKRRPSDTSVIVEAPIDTLINKLVEQGYAWKGDKPKPRAVTKWIFMKPEDIILRFNSVIRGILGYYTAVENRNQFSYILWLLKFSAVFTLSRKLNLSPKQIWKKYGNPVTIYYISKDEQRSIKLFNPNTLSRDRTLKLGNFYNFDQLSVKFYAVRSHHIWDEDCIICGNINNVEMHHVKHIRKGEVKGFTQIMKQLNKKQIPVCRPCHMKIHSGK
jgi:group II intron reverse transcriptase/maturase